MPVFNIHEAKTHFSRLVEDAAAGREVVIAKAGKPIVKLVPLQGDATGKKKPRKLGILAGTGEIPEALFDPLPDDMLAEFEKPLDL
jgi:prevent-host-death family protein